MTPLAQRLRLLVITDAALAGSRSVPDVVAQALSGGAGAIQLRNKQASARELAEQARELLALTRPAEALLFVNDRLDVALAVGADGVHLGPEDLPVEAARSLAAPPFLLGFSTDDPQTARAAEAAGADYLGCGAVFGTTTKDVGAEAIGLERLDAVARAVGIPVVGIGGITPEGARAIAAHTAAAGVAVVGALMAARDPREAAAQLLDPFLLPSTNS